MFASIIVYRSERSMPALTIALFVVSQDGKTEKEDPAESFATFSIGT